MSTFTDIVLTDGEATPVNHTYNPYSQDGTKKSVYATFEDGTPLERSVLTLQPGLGTSNKVRRPSVELRVPDVVTETINGVDIKKEQSFGSAKVQFLLPLNWSEQQCKNLRKQLHDAIDETVVAALVDTGEPIA